MSWLPRFFRGSSGDELEADTAGGRRQSSSAHSTPRLSRARIRDVNGHDVIVPQPRGRQHFGSVGSMEMHRVNPAPANRMRERSWESERMHSVTQPIHPSQQALLNRSWDMDKPPPGVQGLDRAWEMERARGLEILHRSAEKERERRIAQAHNQPHTQRGKDPNKQSKKRKKDKKKENQTMMEQIDNNKLEQERLERRIDELNRMLLEEKHGNRKDKLAVAKLQQEVARQKSERSIRETLTKEFEREKMLRIETERKLQMVSIENEHSQARLHALHSEFQKMEEMVRSLLQFKNKVDQLKQEKATLAISFEKNLQKCRTEISHLEHENKIVMAELKRLEQQCMNCEQCNKDLSYRVTKNDHTEHSDKVKMLLERLKRLEEEKSQLVLENEKQRQNYEKCLDEIANQVVQALLSQKGLREECGKLQKRVLDLEDQNRQLRDMFHHRLKFSSDSVLQGVCVKSAIDPSSQSKAVMGGSCDSITPLSHISLGSLQSICSNYQETTYIEENDPGKPKPSSPPPNLRDVITHGSDVIIQSSTGSPCASLSPPTPATPASMDTVITAQAHGGGGAGTGSHGNTQGQSALMTGNGRSGQASRLILPHGGATSAFHPVSSSHAPALHNIQAGQGNHMITTTANQHLVTYHGQLPLQMHMSQTSTFIPPSVYPRRSGNQTVNEPLSPVITIDNYTPSETDFEIINSIQKAKKRFSQGFSNLNDEDDDETNDSTNKADSKNAELDSKENTELTNEKALPRNEGQADMTSSSAESPSARPKPIRLHLAPNSAGSTPLKPRSDDISPAKQLLKMSDSFPDQYTLNERGDELHKINPKISDFIDYDSDESTSSKAMSNKISMASTMSLTEILERGLDTIRTPNDETFSIDTFQMFDSDDEFKDKDTNTVRNNGDKGTRPKTASAHSITHPNGHQYLVDMRKDERSEVDYGDYVCLRKIREYVYVNMPELMGGSTPGEGRHFKEGSRLHHQKSPGLEEICDCGSCDRLYEEKRQTTGQTMSSDPYSRPTPVVSLNRPSHLQLNNSHSSNPNRVFSPTTSRKFGANDSPASSHPIHFRSHSYQGNTVDYVNTPVNRNCGGEGDYVNITPEYVQQIISAGTLPSVTPPAKHSSVHNYTEINIPPSLPINPQPNTSIITNIKHNQKKIPPQVHPKPRRLDSKRSEEERKASDNEMHSNSGPSNGGSSCCSPDSAMQKSYTSTDSAETMTTEKRTLERLRYGRDEGYSSNSANSIKAESDASRIQSDTSVNAAKIGNIEQNANNNNRKPRDNEKGQVHVSAEIHAHYEKRAGSLTSLHSVSSKESECHPSKVKNIRQSIETHFDQNSTSQRFKSVPSSTPFQIQQRNVEDVTSTKMQHKPTALASTHCSRSHRHRRSHSTSCCLRSRTLAEYHSFVLKRSFSDCNLEKTALCLKAMQLSKQKAAIVANNAKACQSTSGPTRMQPPLKQHHSAQPKTGFVAKQSPIYENTEMLRQQIANNSMHAHQAASSQRPTLSTPYQQARLKMGVSSSPRPNGESWEERRVEGCEQSSAKDRVPAEGKVASNFEEKAPIYGRDVMSQQRSELIFNVIPSTHQKPSLDSHQNSSNKIKRNDGENIQNRLNMDELSETGCLNGNTKQAHIGNGNHLPCMSGPKRHFQLKHGFQTNHNIHKQVESSGSCVTDNPRTSDECNLQNKGYSPNAAIGSMQRSNDLMPGTKSEQSVYNSKSFNNNAMSHTNQLHFICGSENDSSEIATNYNKITENKGASVLDHKQELIYYVQDHEKVKKPHCELGPEDHTKALENLCKSVGEMQASLSDIEKELDYNPSGSAGPNSCEGTTQTAHSHRNNNQTDPSHQRADIKKTVFAQDIESEFAEVIQSCDVILNFLDGTTTPDESSHTKSETHEDICQVYRAEMFGSSESDKLKGQGHHNECEGQGQATHDGCVVRMKETRTIDHQKGSGFLERLVLLSSSSEEEAASLHGVELTTTRGKFDEALKTSENRKFSPVSLDLSPSPTQPKNHPNMVNKSLTNLSPTSFYAPSIESLCHQQSKSSLQLQMGMEKETGVNTIPHKTRVLSDIEEVENDSDASSSSCECEDLEQCPHMHQYELSTGVTTGGNGEATTDNVTSYTSYTSSGHTDVSDNSISYFFEPPLHPRVFELKEDHRLEQDCHVRRVSNAVFEPSANQNDLFKTVLSSQTNDEASLENATHFYAEHFVEETIDLNADDEIDDNGFTENSYNATSYHTCADDINLQPHNNSQEELEVFADDIENRYDLHRSPRSRRAGALRMGGRTTSFDSDNTSVGIDGLSLSDSCCESAEEENV